MSQFSSTYELNLKGFHFHDLFLPAKLAELDQHYLAVLKQDNPQAHTDLLALREGKEFAPEALSELLIEAGKVLDDFVADLFAIKSAHMALKDDTRRHAPVFYFKKWYVLRKARRRVKRLEDVAPFAELDTWLLRTLSLRCTESVEASKGTEQAESAFPSTGSGNADSAFPSTSSGNADSALLDKELSIAQLAKAWMENKDEHADDIEKLIQWCVRVLVGDSRPMYGDRLENWVSFRLPEQTVHQDLVPLQFVPNDEFKRKHSEHLRPRDGFKLTDKRMSSREVQSEIDYCVYCHDHDGDFCSKGFPVKKGEPEQGFKKNPLDVTLTGCPLEEKISEMHVLKRDAFSIGALAMIMADNPMCPATGHRICNDCMKACIYQKQTPVNIPQIETRALSDVLNLPWGVEIYDLLTRWNPLRTKQYLPKPYNGKKILIAGMGPAGFTLAHHLLMEGCAVVGIDGLKIEPLPSELLNQPVRDWHQLEEQLDERIMAGFGGVAEYGITVRWDKNFLKLIYLSLARRPYFQVYGNTRFGGTLKLEDAWALGFDHVSIAVGAGLPQALPIPGSLARGMRQANDFLMALQLTGAAKRESLTNLQVRLPAVVIGGGLTGVDTATEIQAYYVVQVEKILTRYETLVEKHGDTLSLSKGEAWVLDGLDAESQEILQEFLQHGRAIRAERQRAANAGEAPQFAKLIQAWGGVTIAYRRSLQESPAYISNHEELIKAFEEGIYYREHLSPTAVKVDKYGHVQALVCADASLQLGSGQATSSATEPFPEPVEGSGLVAELVLPARSILVATGARPNVAYEFENFGTFHREKFQYMPYQETKNGLEQVPIAEHCKVDEFGAFTSYDASTLRQAQRSASSATDTSTGSVQRKRVSFIGDTHPVFHGNVVKAIASGQKVYPKIVDLLGFSFDSAQDKQNLEGLEIDYAEFKSTLRNQLQTYVMAVKRHTPSVIELDIHAPMAVKAFKPGQFFRLQSFESTAQRACDTLLQTESIAVLGAGVDKEKGMVSVMILEQGASTRLCATLKAGDPIALMGPTGVRTRIEPEGEPETVLFLGGRLGAADIRAVGPALRAAGSRVIYIAGFRSAEEVYCQADLETAADVIVWVTESGEAVQTRREQDRAVVGDYMGAILSYAKGELYETGEPPIALQEVDRVMVVGSSKLSRMVQAAQQDFLQAYLKPEARITASVHSSMQCTLKGVCAQCLQWQIDPETGERTKAVFACSWHNQPIEMVDWDSLDERLAQNRLQEHLSNKWLDYVFENAEIERV